MPVTALLKAIGMNNEQILGTFFQFDRGQLMDAGAQLAFVADRFKGEVARFDITDTRAVASWSKDKAASPHVTPVRWSSPVPPPERAGRFPVGPSAKEPDRS